MKKFWKYRFIALLIIGQILMWGNIYNAESNFKLVLWGIGLAISFIALLLQITMEIKQDNKSNSENNIKCPDCGADLKYESKKLKFNYEKKF
jgi:hypothetical protein